MDSRKGVKFATRLITIFAVAIRWKTCTQETVILSTAEAEYLALSEALDSPFITVNNYFLPL